MKYFIATLVILLLTVIVYHRYLLLTFQSPYVYISRYHKLPHVSTDEKVVIAFSANPNHIHKNRVSSILDQTVKVNGIVAVVKPSDEETVATKTYIPDVGKIVPFGIDAGHISAIVSSLLREKDCNTVVISPYMNRVYPKNYIERMYKEHLKYPNALLYNNYCILASPKMFGCILDEKAEYTFEWLLENAGESMRIPD